MSKRTDAIRSMFSMEAPLSADNKSPAPRVAAGSVRSMRDTFSNAERENEELRARLAAGAEAIDLDPLLIDPSPLADRFKEDDPADFELLKTSIAEKGQLLPVLVRPHPERPGRFQSAYGHRRVRAVQALGLRVKAFVREMQDADLVVAQGIENSARKDLSFIERALFAARIEDAGFERPVTQHALSIDRAEASKLVAVARAIPRATLERIGPAPKVGRTPWLTLARAFGDRAAVKRIMKAMEAKGFDALSSNERFQQVHQASGNAAAAGAAAGRSGSIRTRQGRELARFSLSGGHIKIAAAKGAEDFAAFIAERLPELGVAFAAAGEPADHRG